MFRDQDRGLVVRRQQDNWSSKPTGDSGESIHEVCRLLESGRRPNKTIA